MAGAEVEASNVTPAYTDGTQNSNVLLFAVSTTHFTAQIPSEWASRYVILRSITSNARWLISKNSSAEVDYTLAAASNGQPSPKLGAYLPEGEIVHVLLPPLSPGEKLYLSAEGNTSGGLEIRKGSGPLLP